jgi:hypothetical protein
LDPLRPLRPLRFSFTVFINKEIINPDQFRDGLSKIIDGTVACLNASSWAKK